MMYRVMRALTSAMADTLWPLVVVRTMPGLHHHIMHGRENYA